MLNNSMRSPINLNVSYDIPYKSATSSLQKTSSDKQRKVNEEFNPDYDTDFHSFLLPLEQDFTKSSKGYASLLSVSPDKNVKSIDYNRKLKRSEVSMLPCEISSDNEYLKNAGKKLLNDNLSHFNDHNNFDNLYNEKCAKFIHNTVDYIKNDQNGESTVSKNHITKIYNSPQNSQNGDVVSEAKENILHLEKCVKTTNGFSVSFFNLSRFIDKSDDDNDDSSESSENGSLDKDNECNNSLNIDDGSNSDNSIIFSGDEKIENWISSIEIEQTFITTINSDNCECSEAEGNGIENFKEGTTSSLSKDFEFDSVNLENPVPSQRNIYDRTVAWSSEGYINPSFEADDFLFEGSSFLKDINDSWNDSMKDISEEPHQSKRVSFVPLPDLVSVFSYETEDDGYRYSLHVLDQLRFQNRVKDFESIIAPYLTAEHRASIYQRHCLQD